MNNPKLNFQLDMPFDQWTGNTFLSFESEDIFSNSVLRNHPKLAEVKTMDKDARKAFVNDYVATYYKDHEKEIADALDRMIKDWAAVSAKFYELVDKLFPENDGKYKWLDGTYTCYLSIFNCNPRFIKDKYFGAFYKHNETVNYVCMHELLHFAFYDYIERNFPEDYKTLGDDGMWKLSEIFNDIIFRQPDFVAVTGQPNPNFYAETKEELERFNKMYDPKSGAGVFIKMYLKFL